MQIFIFLTCLLCGIISGLVYDVLYIARCVLCGVDKQSYTVKDKIFIIAADIIYCLVLATGFIFVSVMFGFSSLRLYMLIGCVLGALLYLKSFHQIVAFFAKKVYNRVTSRKKVIKRERNKEKPHRSGINRRRRVAYSNLRGSDNLSVGDDSKH